MLNKKICKKCRALDKDITFKWIKNSDRLWDSGRRVSCPALDSSKHDGRSISRDSIPPKKCKYKLEHAVAASMTETANVCNIPLDKRV